jgi:hexosaminidase
MRIKNYVLLFSFLFVSFQAMTQSGLSKSDSIILKEKVVFQQSVSKGTSTYQIPVNLDGFSIQLVGSDNLSVITKAGKIFQPLSDLTVNLLFKVTKQSDNSSMEIAAPVKVQGQNPNRGINSKPFVIPSLREWYGYDGRFILSHKSRIVVDVKDKSILKKVATILQNDLKILSNIKPAIVFGSPKAGDIYISLRGQQDELGKEGYYLSIKEYVTINAANYKGAFWGTRTVLQILEQDTKHCSLPKGLTRDYPKYELRGFLLDLGRKYFKIDFLRDYVKLMSYYKISDFQLHLSDNAFVKHYNNNWDSTYCGFRLENSTYPQLPTKGEFYTKKEFVDLQILAEQYGVNIIPEIDVPAHSLPFSKAFPQIASKEFGNDHLDIKNPETYSIIENVFKEYLEGENPVFRNKEVHIGTDEYAKKEAEAFRKFTDHFIKYVQGFGKDVRVWGALTHAQGTTPVTSKGVTMNAWYNGYADPVEMKKQGYPLISTPDGLLYIVPAAGYYYDYLNLKYLYNNWEPVIIGDAVFEMGDPFIRGGMFAVWNDVGKNGITAQDVTDRVFPAVQVLSAKMWSGADTAVHFADFASKAKFINETPGLNLRGKIQAKDSLVVNFKMNGKDTKVKLNQAAYTADEGRNVLHLSKKNSYVTLPHDEIGYNYTVSFMLNPSENNAANAILFQSKHATLKLKQGATSNLGFSHEGKNYDFGVQIPEKVWSNITITGDNNSTTLYLNGKQMKKLTREKVPTGYKTDSIWEMRTLFFPLRTIGDSKNSFVGKMKNLKVFNQIISPQQIRTIQ